MPCYTIQTNTVELTSIKDHDILEAALKAEFGAVSRMADGRMIFTVGGFRAVYQDGEVKSQLAGAALQSTVNQIKRAYTRETMAAGARRYGWRMTPSKTHANQGTIIKL